MTVMALMTVRAYQSTKKIISNSDGSKSGGFAATTVAAGMTATARVGD